MLSCIAINKVGKEVRKRNKTSYPYEHKSISMKYNH